VADEKHPEIIIIKRHSSHEEEHHGGAWKIAFADFMTAMMAFFLVLWIINATDKNTKTVIARYFNPLKLEDMAKAKKGIRQSDGNDFPDVKTTTDETAGDAKSKEPPQGAPESAPKEAAKEASKEAPKEAPAKESEAKSKEPVDAAHPKAQLPENTLFNDPLASLEKIAGKVEAPSDAPPNALSGSEPKDAPGSPDLDAIRDPFKPWTPSATSETPVAPKPPTTPQPAPEAEKQPQPENVAKTPAPQPAAQTAVATPAEVDHAPAAAAVAEAEKLQNDIAKELRAELHAQPAPGIAVQATSEGTLISLTDEYNFGMFASDSAEPQPKVVRIMEKIAQLLKSRPGSIVVRGHTDARPYKAGTYDNWRLSSARAQMAYYMLIRGGLDEKRFERIEGHADRQLKTPGKPEAAENRRIEILLRKDKS
jgi:chemotaxis protein MotB